VINEPIDFNSGLIPNLEPISFVTEKKLKFRNDSNIDSVGMDNYSKIHQQNFLMIQAERTVNFLNLLKLSALSNTTVDILDDLGNIIKTIPDINKYLFEKSILKHIIENTNNSFVNRELENYVLLPQNQVPINIVNNKIQVVDVMKLDYFLITLANIN